MDGFFHGWRRKFGVVTLVMACVLTALWVRSIAFWDIKKSGGDSAGRCYLVESDNGGVTLGQTENSRDAFAEFHCWSDPVSESNNQPPLSPELYTWRWKAMGFDFARLCSRNGSVNITYWTIPYWSLVIPLTFVSAFLLLSRPRQSTANKAADPIPSKMGTQHIDGSVSNSKLRCQETSTCFAFDNRPCGRARMCYVQTRASRTLLKFDCKPASAAQMCD